MPRGSMSPNAHRIRALYIGYLIFRSQEQHKIVELKTKNVAYDGNVAFTEPSLPLGERERRHCWASG